MSVNGRLPARRVLTNVLNSATHIYKAENDEDSEYVPNLTLLPTGVSANKFMVGGLVTEKAEVLENSVGTVLLDIEDPSGTLTVSATEEYSKEAADFLKEVDPPVYVLLVVKRSSYEDDEGEIRYTTSVQNGEHAVLDWEQYKQWENETIKQSVDQVAELFNDPQYTVEDADPILQYGEETPEEMRDLLVETINNLAEEDA